MLSMFNFNVVFCIVRSVISIVSVTVLDIVFYVSDRCNELFIFRHFIDYIGC